MFSLRNECTLDKGNDKIDIINYSPTSSATINNNSSTISIRFPREDPYFCSQNSFKSIEIEVLKNDDTRYAVGDEIPLVNFGTDALLVRLS